MAVPTAVFLLPRAPLSYSAARAEDLECAMRLDLATIVLVAAWAFNVHATPVYSTSRWEVHEPVDTTSMQAVSDDSIQFQAIAVEELLSTATPDGIDEPLGPGVSFDTSLPVGGGFGQAGEMASAAHDVDLPFSYSHYYFFFFLALVPLGFVGFTILKGWYAWKMQCTRDLHASRRGRASGENPRREWALG